MRVVVWLGLSVSLAGCVPPAPGPYGGRVQQGGYPGYYAPAYPPPYPPGLYASPGLLPLPEGARTGRAVVRARPATPSTTSAAAPAAPTPGPAVVPASAPLAGSSGPECRTVTQLSYAEGREVQRQERFCRAAPGRDWVRS